MKNRLSRYKLLKGKLPFSSLDIQQRWRDRELNRNPVYIERDRHMRCLSLFNLAKRHRYYPLYPKQNG